MTRRSRNLIFATVLLATLVAAAIFGIHILRTAIRLSLEDESRFHAAILAHGAILRFESEYDRLPTSWDDFDSMTPLEWSGFGLPRDIEAIQQWVTIDFDALQTADPITDAIHPTGMTYDHWKDILPPDVNR